MKYFNKIKDFTIQFMVVYIFFIIIYLPMCYLLNQDFNYDSIIMGGVCSILVASTRIMVKEENEKNQEFIKSNYWKLKNELSRRTNGNQKRKRNSK